MAEDREVRIVTRRALRREKLAAAAKAANEEMRLMGPRNFVAERVGDKLIVRKVTEFDMPF